MVRFGSITLEKLVVRGSGQKITNEPDPKLVALIAKEHDW